MNDLLPDLEKLGADGLVADLEGAEGNLFAITNVAILVTGLFRQKDEHLDLKILVNFLMSEASQH